MRAPRPTRQRACEGYGRPRDRVLKTRASCHACDGRAMASHVTGLPICWRTPSSPSIASRPSKPICRPKPRPFWKRPDEGSGQFGDHVELGMSTILPATLKCSRRRMVKAKRTSWSGRSFHRNAWMQAWHCSGLKSWWTYERVDMDENLLWLREHFSNEWRNSHLWIEFLRRYKP
jgi:hypothetical protein